MWNLYCLSLTDLSQVTSNSSAIPILVTQLKYLCSEQKQGMNLKYLDFNNCFSILSKFAFLLPNLVEIRIGSDAPPQMRLTTARYYTPSGISIQAKGIEPDIIVEAGITESTNKSLENRREENLRGALDKKDK